jgi:ABC-2 type transport system ATP-binding protein
MTEPVLRFQGVQRWFGEQVVLSGLSFDVMPGQVYALLGRNGAGKTTALRILLGFLAPHAGSVQVLGCDSRQLMAQVRSRLGYVGEEHRLYATMSVAGAVAFEAATRAGFRRDFVNKALQRCGLRMGQRIPRLSRGQRATLSLVLAIGSQPELLVCDDPALGLDVVMRRELLDVLIDLLADTGCSVLLSSHQLNEVERIADRVGILKHGALLVDATLDDLRRRVRRCMWSARRDGAPPEELPWLAPHLLNAQRRGEGWQLMLADVPAPVWIELQASGVCSEPEAPTLEELFLALVGQERSGSVRDSISGFLVTDTGGV